MGLGANIESRYIQKVVAALTEFAPGFEPTKVRVPCQGSPEFHTGIRIGNPESGYLFMHKCEQRWWARHVHKDEIARLNGHISDNTITAANAGAFMAITPTAVSTARAIAGHLDRSPAT